MATSSNSVFTGASSYSSDFQNVIARSVAIASLPLTQLQNQKSDLQARTSAVGGVKVAIDTLQSTIHSLDSVTSTGRVSTTSSASTVASVKSSVAVLPGTYQLNVISLGSNTSTLSSAGLTAVSDPATQSISSATSFTLAINGVNLTVTPAASNLNSLAAAINALPSANVRATIVNLGSSESPDYRLSIQGTKLAADTISLTDGTTPLLDPITTGAAGSIEVNGSPNPISISSRDVLLAPGLTATIAGAGSTTINVSTDNSAFSGALASFVSAYNASVSAVDAQRGSQAGALAGDNLVQAVGSGLTRLVDFQGSGAIGSLTDLGLSFDQNGVLSLDTTAFQAALTSHESDVRAFLGGASTGGFLQAATSVLSELDGTSGLLPLAATSLASSLTSQDNLITNAQAHVDQMRQALTGQLNAADAAIASLQQELVYVKGLFATQTTTT